MKAEKRKELIDLRIECNQFYENITYKIDDLCNSIGFREASKLSHIADRLDLFIKELNEF